ncbi:MAG: LysR family transcriptional regulator [Afipia sp.]|nr:LysR family transcriptional regulator [Afipia sp.]
MQYRQLRYFIKIVEAGSFSRAAATIHVAQPALSQQVAKLEEELGQKLLHRTHRGVQPTPAGQVLYDRGSLILRQLDELPGMLTASTGEISGTVSLGIVASLADVLIGPVIEHFKSALPKVLLKCSDGDSKTLAMRVQEHKLDLAVIFEHDFGPTVSRTPIFSQRLFLIGKKLPRQPRSSISLEEIARLPLVLPGRGNERRRLIDHAFAELELVPNVIAEADNLSSELSAVRTGIGHTMLNIGVLTGKGHEALAAPVLIEPPISMICSVIQSGDFCLSAPGEAVRKSTVELIRTFVTKTARPGAELIGL